MTPLNQTLQKAKELENTLHISTLLSPLAREQARIDIRERIEIMDEDGELTEDTDPYIYATANGFVNINSNSDTNANGETYIFMAFAEASFVNSKGVPNNAR